MIVSVIFSPPPSHLFDSFVDRYIPGYVFFGDGVRKGTQDEEGQGQLPPWHNKGLVVTIDLERKLLGTSHF